MYPDSTFAYVGCRTTRERNARGTGIGIHAIDPATQAWRHVGTHPTLDNPSFLALNAQQTMLYAVHGDGGDVSAYRIDPASGRLTDLGARACGGRNPVHLAPSRDGRWLAVANYASGSVVRLPVGADGALGEAWRVVPMPGEPGPHPREQGASHPHQIARYVTRAADSDWHIVPDKGLDTVFAVRWRGDGEGDAEIVAHRWRAGSGPRHAVWHPLLPLVYVANELDSTMTVWRFEVATGQMAALDTIGSVPGAHAGGNTAAGIVIAPDARALYMTNRGHDSVATIALDAASGLPRAVSWTPTGGEFPRFLCLGPDGRRLFVANERSDSIVEFLREPDGAGLVRSGQTIATGSPVCVVFRTVA